MQFRSISCHQGWPNPKVVRLAARLGFNDVCFQTECGLLEPIRALVYRGRRSGTFELITSLGMSVSLWVHEFSDYNEQWGRPSPDNAVLWRELSNRYDYILTELMPEIDSLVLTVVETQVKATDPELLRPLATTIKAACDRHGRGFILRSFVHHPEELDQVSDAISSLPDDITIMTKAVPQDWHMRSVDDPLIGKVGDKPQVVEVDIAGEYWHMEHVANCFTDVLSSQYKRWIEAGCSGISVRVDRGWVPWEYQHCVQGQPHEANLWVLGYLCQGRSEDEAWHNYTTHVFGAEAAPAMEAALRPAGDVVAEALYVLDEPFGDYRSANPLRSLLNGERAVAYEDCDDAICRNPFNLNYSVFRWDDAHRPAYQKIRRGHPEIIDQKSRQYSEAKSKAERSLTRIDAARVHLDPNAFAFFRFKLEENLFHLELFSEAHLAWLKLSCRLYGLAPQRDESLLAEARAHLARLEQMTAEAKQRSLVCEWNGEVHRLQRGRYADIPGILKSFADYWGQDAVPCL